VNDKLALHGTVVLERQRFHVRQVIHGHCCECAAHASRKDVAFHIAIADAVPEHVLGDRRRLLQVLKHVTTNALRSTNRGRISVTVDLPTPLSTSSREPSDKLTLRIVVVDTGVGIQQQHLERATYAVLHEEKASGGEATDNETVDFRTADDWRAWRSGRANGRTMAFGIAICQRLVHAMGGTFDMSSTYGEGTHVELFLPFEKTFSGTHIAPRRASTMRRPFSILRRCCATLGAIAR